MHVQGALFLQRGAASEGSAQLPALGEAGRTPPLCVASEATPPSRPPQHPPGSPSCLPARLSPSCSAPPAPFPRGLACPPPTVLAGAWGRSRDGRASWVPKVGETVSRLCPCEALDSPVLWAGSGRGV